MCLSWKNKVHKILGLILSTHKPGVVANAYNPSNPESQEFRVNLSCNRFKAT